jgi:hypothetical protein
MTEDLRLEDGALIDAAGRRVRRLTLEERTECDTVHVVFEMENSELIAATDDRCSAAARIIASRRRYWDPRYLLDWARKIVAKIGGSE